MDPIDMMITDMNCEDLELSRLCLMENAGKSLSDEVAKISTYHFSKPVKIAIFTGSGGNAGDGFVAARHLLNRGFEVELFMLSSLNEIKSADAKINLKILLNLKPLFSRLKINHLKDSSDLEGINLTTFSSFSEYIIIDAILGTGIKGKLKTIVKKVIETINKLNALKISVDVPSGRDPLSGKVYDIAIKPEYTVTFHKAKTGVKNSDENLVGDIVICDIGIPLEAELFINNGDLLRLNDRKSYSHKGNNGKILIIGGNKEYHGAPTIAGMSALSTGADLVYITSPESTSPFIKQYSPDFIVKGLEGDYLNLNNLDEILNMIDKVDAVLIGPGSGQEEETRKLFNILSQKIEKPLIIDADALKLISPSLVKNKEDLILTPHLTEFKRFFIEELNDLGINVNDLSLISDDWDYNKLKEKISNFQKITKLIKGTTVLKGKYDLVFSQNKFKLNKTGNSGMTVGGTGDSLAGVCASFLSRGLNSYDSGLLATYLNGKAGDLAKEKYGYGFKASQLPKLLSILMKDL